MTRDAFVAHRSVGAPTSSFMIKHKGHDVWLNMNKRPFTTRKRAESWLRRKIKIYHGQVSQLPLSKQDLAEAESMYEIVEMTLTPTAAFAPPAPPSYLKQDMYRRGFEAMMSNASYWSTVPHSFHERLWFDTGWEDAACERLTQSVFFPDLRSLF